MKAVIVAAGEGKRLRPITEETPKPLLKIKNKTIIEHQLENLKKHGINEVVLVVGYKLNKIKEFVDSVKPEGMKITYVSNPFYATTNDMASLWFAKEYVKGEEFLYIHGDLLNHPNLIEKCLKTEGDIVLVVDSENFDEESMKVKVENGLVLESSKEIPLDEAYGEWIGLIKFSPRGGELMFTEIENALNEGHFNVYDTFALTRLAKKGHEIRVCDTEGSPWIEIDFKEDLENAINEIYPRIKNMGAS